MPNIAWIRWLHDNWLDGTRKLSLEERGAYADIISLIAKHVDELPNDDGYIAGWLRCHVRTWKRIKARLIDTGKLKIDGDKLRNGRATNECLLAVSKRTQAASKGRKGGLNRPGSKSLSGKGEMNKNKGIAQAPDQAQLEAQLEKTVSTGLSPASSDYDEVNRLPPKKGEAVLTSGAATLASPPEGGSLHGAEIPDFLNRNLNGTGMAKLLANNGVVAGSKLVSQSGYLAAIYFVRGAMLKRGEVEIPDRIEITRPKGVEGPWPQVVV